MIDKKEYGDMALGTGVGLAAYVGGKKLATKYVKKTYGKFAMKSMTEGFSQAEIDTFKKAAQQAYNNSNLASRGVEFFNVTSENINKLNQQLNNKIIEFAEKIMRKLGYNDKSVLKFRLKNLGQGDGAMYKAFKITAEGKMLSIILWGKLLMSV